MAIVIPASARLATVTELTTAGVLDGVKVALFKNDLLPTPFSKLADFTEADFTGYARSAVLTWGSAFTDAAMNAIAVAGSIQFNCTGSTTGNIIYGYYVITPGTPDELQFAERFPSPVGISQAGQAVVLLPKYVFGQ